MMNARSKLRRLMKGIELATCGLTAAALVFSYVHPLYPTWLKPDATWFVGLGHGCIEGHYPAGVLVHQSGWLFRSQVHACWLPRFWRISTLTGRTCWYALLPLWAVFAAVSVPTAVLWRLDRRPPRGHCQSCGYDLTGNTSGVCPECGEPL